MSLLQKHPLLSGLVIGTLLSILLTVACPAEVMKPGDSRALIAAVGLIVLVPLSILTVYAARSALRVVKEEPRMRVAWLFFAATMVIFCAVGTWFQWKESRRYLAEGRSVMGKVLEMHPEDHDTLVVGYTAEGMSFRVRTHAPRVARSYHSDEPIQVYYHASAPGQGFCDEPRWEPSMAVFSCVVGAGLLPLWLIGCSGPMVVRVRAAVRRTPSAPAVRL
ncbi:hypothetical protein [Prosthecobacter sp.]|uniref:hypothetical protein n=1 Tax=Prosthecobacter sp. TaxID=1965333 RepID=UPI003785152F